MANKLIEILYKKMYRIRRFEEMVADLYPTDMIQSPIHLSIGQEAVSVVVCHNIEKEDSVFASYRGHAAYIAKGGSLKELMAELYGKETGCCKGNGGSMHLIEPSVNFMGTSAIVASTVPIATGFAYGQKMQRKDNITVVFLGDGAMDEGSVWESINFAVIKHLPIIFVLENNFYAIHSHVNSRSYSTHFGEKVKAFGMNYEFFDIDIMNNNSRAFINIKRCRELLKPIFMEFVTYRYKEHVGPNDDINLGYRTQEELDYWKGMDQLEALKKQISRKELFNIKAEIELEIVEAIEFAKSSDNPPPENCTKNIYE